MGKWPPDLLGLASRMSYASYASQVSEASPCVERPNFRVKPMQQHLAFFFRVMSSVCSCSNIVD